MTTRKGDRVFLDVTDTAGQEAFVAIRDHYIQNGDGFMLVYSITDERSFQQLNHIRFLSETIFLEFENLRSLKFNNF